MLSLYTLFPEYTKCDLDIIYRTRGKDFKNTCEFLLDKKSKQCGIERERKIRRIISGEEDEIEHQQLVIQKVMKMSECTHPAQMIAKDFGMCVCKLTYEDCARTKNSFWGLCICDMTLQVCFQNQSYKLPVIRYSNFQDLTWDIPMNKIFLMIGNESGNSELRRVTLLEYLDNICTNGRCSLYCEEKDSHVLVSCQACILPAGEGTEPTFNVALYSYQSHDEDPAVLTIIASAQGSSAQIIGKSTQKLYFNNNGRKASFVGQRLKDNRKERGVDLQGDMTKEEKEANMIMMIQVPLKQKPRVTNFAPKQYDTYRSVYICDKVPCAKVEKDEDNMEDVIIKVSDKDEGPFPRINKQKLTRDTLQFYKATCNGIIDRKTMEMISEQFVKSQTDADFIGSLVTGLSIHRPTDTTDIM